MMGVVNSAQHDSSVDLNKAIRKSNNGDTIQLIDGVYRNNVTDIVIDKNLTIQGNSKDNNIIDAANMGRIFNITPGNKLILINISFINRFAALNSNTGGIIYNNQSTLIIEDYIFDNNIANRSGGVIYNTGNITIKNSEFTNNQIIQNFDTQFVSGGVIYTNGGICEIFNSIFLNNSLSYNRLSGSGGGVIYQASGITRIYHSNFQSNFANNTVAGILYIDKGDLEIFSSIFLNIIQQQMQVLYFIVELIMELLKSIILHLVIILHMLGMVVSYKQTIFK
ncbi:hypothetical protein ALNOE001_09270 [Candidatus Methanobinarius endosymbioticus]|uniref:Right handed beta helix domain-containing protein n=1 Tax=Candidatus Methanobinarius endosymbioticus TaxID=2006182 RepID=A0A366MCP4_9EURY|nr:hypothetical protein ALNOE001_09270 [Candidatus Methanobinarius endosymbioticus]